MLSVVAVGSADGVRFGALRLRSSSYGGRGRACALPLPKVRHFCYWLWAGGVPMIPNLSNQRIPIHAAILTIFVALAYAAAQSAMAGDASAPFSTGAAEQGQAAPIPFRSQNGAMAWFSAQELQQLPSIIGNMQAQPSFDCARARSAAENAICASPELAALDNGLNWLWRRSEHGSAETAAQARWLVTRNGCPESEENRLQFRRCLEQAYVARIKDIAPKTPSSVVGSGRYTSDTPLRLPKGEAAAALMHKYLSTRGYSADEITIDVLGSGNGRIAGYANGANGHSCSLTEAEAGMKRAGAVFRATADGDMADFIITPDVVIVGNTRFQCGARAGWSETYYRQPDDLIEELKQPLDMNDPG